MSGMLTASCCSKGSPRFFSTSSGVYAMIDDGELDWKVIAINAEDPKAALVNDVEDVER